MEKLEPWQQRVIEDLEQLREKQDKLAEFFRQAKCSTMDEGQRCLLSAQWSAMEAYEKILKTRVKLWEAQSCR